MFASIVIVRKCEFHTNMFEQCGIIIIIIYFFIVFISDSENPNKLSRILEYSACQIILLLILFSYFAK